MQIPLRRQERQAAQTKGEKKVAVELLTADTARRAAQRKLEEAAKAATVASAKAAEELIELAASRAAAGPPAVARDRETVVAAAWGLTEAGRSGGGLRGGEAAADQDVWPDVVGGRMGVLTLNRP